MNLNHVTTAENYSLDSPNVPVGLTKTPNVQPFYTCSLTTENQGFEPKHDRKQQCLLNDKRR